MMKEEYSSHIGNTHITKKEIVSQYLDGFRTGDQHKIISCLADDVVWRLHGCDTYIGKKSFEDNITNEEFCAIPKLEVRELIEENDRVVAVGFGAIFDEARNIKNFAFTEIFLFSNAKIVEVDTFHVWIE